MKSIKASSLRALFSGACVLAGISLVASFATGPVHAATVYYYTGNYFNTFWDMSPPAGSYTSIDYVSGSITLQNPLPANMNWSDVAPIALGFSFTDGRNNTITNLNAFGATLDLKTGASGQIIDWYINVQTAPALLVGQQHVEINARTDATGDYAIFSQAIVGDCPQGFQPPCQVNWDQGGIPNSPGIWSGPIAETPLPAALPLFVTGLGAFGLASWRRNRKNAAAA